MRHSSCTVDLRLQIIPAGVNRLRKILHMFMLEVFRDHKIRGPEPVEKGSWRVCTFQSASFLKLVCNIIEFNCSAKLGLDQNQNMTKDLKSTAYKQPLHKKMYMERRGYRISTSQLVQKQPRFFNLYFNTLDVHRCRIININQGSIMFQFL